MKKTAIIYGRLNTGIQKKALEVLSEFILDYTYNYPACFRYDQCPDLKEFICIYIGTVHNNPHIKEATKNRLEYDEEYSITVKDGNVYIEGYDDIGVLYGCVDFYSKYLVKLEYPHDDRYCVNPFEENLPDFEYLSHPSIKNRGIWTWGHVIYDYRRFIDNMVKLKMNTVIIWNDFAPLNASELVAYAHNCGIKVIWGFSWLWDTDCLSVDIKNINNYSADIFDKYEKEYAALGGDGVYFQSFTEIRGDTIDGVLVAGAVTDFVNNTASLFYKKYPDLELQFGLHATSVKEKLSYIKNVNPKIRIVWEDCGAFPFSYIPNDIEDFENTKSFVQKTALLRGTEDKFGVVTKGFTKLDWRSFEHSDGAMFSGVCSKHMKDNRVSRKRKIWKYLQAYWLTNADKAYEMVRYMNSLKHGDLYITALVEDGMFEENIMYPVALYAEMMWNCNIDLQDMISMVALWDYVDFV